MTPPFQRFLDDQRELGTGSGGRRARRRRRLLPGDLPGGEGLPDLRDSNVRAVLTIAQHKATDHHRARARYANAGGADRQAAAPALPDDEVWDAVRSLPPRQRAAILLRYAGDLSHREVGTVLGCSEEAARRSAHEGLKRLRQEVPAP